MEKMIMEMLKRIEALETRVKELELENEELYERINDLEDSEIE